MRWPGCRPSSPTEQARAYREIPGFKARWVSTSLSRTCKRNPMTLRALARSRGKTTTTTLRAMSSAKRSWISQGATDSSPRDSGSPLPGARPGTRPSSASPASCDLFPVCCCEARRLRGESHLRIPAASVGRIVPDLIDKEYPWFYPRLRIFLVPFAQRVWNATRSEVRRPSLLGDSVRTVLGG